MQDAAAINDLLLAKDREIERLRYLNAELLATNTQLGSKIEHLEARLDWLVRKVFGRSSERVNPAQGTLFAEPEGIAEPEAAPSEPIVDKPVNRGRPHGRRKPPKDLPREVERIDIPECDKTCPCCGNTKICIGHDTTERHDYQPTKIFLRVTERPTYICRACEQKGDDIQASQAPLPPEPIPKGIAAAGLLAQVIVSKYWDHLPLYRQEGIFARLGWNVSRSTLGDMVMKSADVLAPIYLLMCGRVRQSAALHTDDTTVTLQGQLKKASVWVYAGDTSHPFTVFDLSTSREGIYPQAFLKGYKGFIHADGYTGYNPLYEAGATHIGCWAHVRRKFFEAKDNDPLRSHEAIARIRALYAIETELKKMREDRSTDHYMLNYRTTRAGPLLDEFGEWLAVEAPKALPKSRIGEAFTYAVNQWPTLIRYPHDLRLNIDNNPAEQAVRPIALGRKNWLHIGGLTGLPSAAVLMSLAASAKRHGCAPWHYVKDLLTQLPARSPGADLTDLLPDTWARQHAAT